MLANIYQGLPAPLRDVAISAYGTRLAWLRYAGSYRARMAQLLQTQFLDAAAMRELQESQLARIVDIAARHSPYYREMGLAPGKVTLETLHRHVPILEKGAFRAAQKHFESTLHPESACYRINTSGTTGSPVSILAHREAIRENYAFFGRFLRWGGVFVRQRSATFSGRNLISPSQTKPPFWAFNAVTNTMHYSSYHLGQNTAARYLASLERLQPVYIDAYPSAVFALAQAKNRADRGYDIRPHVIFTSSETLLAHQRLEIETAFGCKVMDQYGSAEMAGFIAQCEFGTYHVNPEYGVVEIVDAAGEPVGPGVSGRLVLTGFLNTAMPLLRYEIGDVAMFSGEQCGCRRAFPVIAEITGRMDDVIVTPDGRQVGRLDPVFKGGEGIVEAQIVQEAPDRVTVLIVPERGSISPEGASSLRAELARRLGPLMHLEIREVTAIPRTKAGKFRAVVSKIRAG